MVRFEKVLRDRSGMSVIELIIVICILGILAAVGVPTYTRYVQQAKVISRVIPVIYIVETNITVYHSLNNEMPDNDAFLEMLEDVDTSFLAFEFANETLTITLDVPAGGDPLLAKLNGDQLTATPKIVDDKIVSWNLGGAIAEDLDITY